MAGSSRVRAGGAFVELYADQTALERALKGAEAKVRAFGATVSSIGNKMALAGGIIKAAFVGAAVHWSESAREIGKLSVKTGIAAELLSGLAYAANRSGVDTDQLATGLKKMQKTLYDAATGSAEAQESLAALGLTIKDLAGLSPEGQIMAFADAFKAIEDPTVKTALALKVFGKSGTDMLPMLSKGSEALKELAAEAPHVFTNEEIGRAKEFRAAMVGLTNAAKEVSFAIGSAVAPAIAETGKAFTAAILEVVEWLKHNGSLIVMAFKAAGALLAVGLALKAVGAAAGICATAIKALRVAFMFLYTHPIIALTAIAAALLAVGVAARTASAEMKLVGPAGGGNRNEFTDMADALGDLSLKARLNNDEMAQAAVLIKTLTDKYGDLGFGLNRTTGQIEAQAGAWKRLYTAIRAPREKTIGAELLSKASEEDRKKAEKIADYNRKLQDEVYRARLWHIREEEDREQVALFLTVTRKREEARAAGADVSLVEEEYDEKMAEVRQKFARKRADEEARQVENLANLITDIDEETQKAKIEGTMQGLDKEQALLEIQHGKERAAALELGAGREIMAQLEEKHRLQRDLLGMAGKAATTTAGQFGGYNLAGLGAGGTPERIAKGVEAVKDIQKENNKLMERILKKLEGPAFG